MEESDLVNDSEKDGLLEILSFYRFLNLTSDQLVLLADSITGFAKANELKGLVIAAKEGLNGTVCCDRAGMDKFKNFLLDYSNGEDWKFKISACEFNPFKRFSLKFRSEIVTSGNLNLKPNMLDDSHISPDEWHEILLKQNDYVLIDVRNDYEVDIGKFKGALDPKTKDFKEFPDFVKNSNIDKNTKILMYCTGGIRCEKAFLEMKDLGYSDIKQLDGGILSYIEKYPDGFFEGECFVFDERVALDKSLRPSKQYSLCPHCGDPASEIIKCKLCEKEMKVCNDCLEEEKRQTCSKNCRYHYNQKLIKNQS